MGASTDWYSTNHHLAYPFTERQPGNLHELFVDAFISYNKNRDDNRLLRLVKFDPTTGLLVLCFSPDNVDCGCVSPLVVNACDTDDDLIVLNSTDSYLTNDVGLYRVYSWTRTSTDGGFTNKDVIARLVVLISELSNFSFPVQPALAYLLPSLVNPPTAGVRRMALAIRGFDCCGVGGGFTASPYVQFEEGNNMSIGIGAKPNLGGLNINTSTSKRTKTNIVFDCVPGAGAGAFINCDSTNSEIKQINNVAPDGNGNFKLAGDECLWVERRTATATTPIHQNTDVLATMQTALLELHQSCRECCACSDYGAAYDAIADVWTRAKSVARRIEILRKQTNKSIDNLKATILTMENGLNVKLRYIVRPDYHLALLATVFNNSCTDLGITSVRFDISPNSASYITKSGMLDAEKYRGIQVDPLISVTPDLYTMEITFPSVKAGSFVSYSLDTRFAKHPTDTIENLYDNKYLSDVRLRANSVARCTCTATSGSQVATSFISTGLSKPLELT